MNAWVWSGSDADDNSCVDVESDPEVVSPQSNDKPPCDPVGAPRSCSPTKARNHVWAFSSDDDDESVVELASDRVNQSTSASSAHPPKERSRSPGARPVNRLVLIAAPKPQSFFETSASMFPKPKFHKPCLDEDNGTLWWFSSFFDIVYSKVTFVFPMRPMVHCSVYSGLLSEIEMSGDLGVWQRTIGACDVKAAAQAFAKHNHQASCEHYFVDVNQAITGIGICALHVGRYCVAAKTTIDCLSGGAPCTAWASTRDKTKDGPRTGGVTAHPDFQHTFVKYFEFIDAHDVRGGYFEQVKGFAFKQASVPRGFASPMLLFIHILEERGYKVTVVSHNNNSIWCEVPRDRCLCLCFRRRRRRRRCRVHITNRISFVFASIQLSCVM